jgi:2-polyprenyl-3-methyl-5-hydroxy-6-metoxy-1,4-benzoquinol methylase
MPLPEDLAKAYVTYYTHSPQDTRGPSGRLKRMYVRMKLSYLAQKYGYRSPETPGIPGTMLYFFPLRRAAADASIRYLRAVSNGRVLDVGCGSGEWLATMRELGWAVDGLDFDANAVRIARQTGLNVRCGALEEQGYADGAFDAVTLNHVVEHLPDPIATLRECARVLKKGGNLVLATPNIASLSHKIYKNDWRGLEPPRHLHIFSPAAMRKALELAGFRDISIRPGIAASVIYESTLLRRGRSGPSATALGDRSAKLTAILFNLLELGLVKWKPSVADCLTAIATRN